MSSPFFLEDTPAGNDLDIERDIPGVSMSDPIIKAWLTIKVNRTDADPGVLQKIISSTPVNGVGQIVQDGSASNGDGTGSVWFQITAAETTTLGTVIRYWFDIQARTSAGKVYTVSDETTGATAGRLQLRPRITLAAT